MKGRSGTWGERGQLTAGAVPNLEPDLPNPAGHSGELADDVDDVVKAAAREHLTRRVKRRQERKQRRH